MGLDIYCDCGTVGFRAGSYSGFGQFRTFLATELLKYPEKTYSFPGLNNNTLKLNSYEVPDTNSTFAKLLLHSDCDGTLTPRDCKHLLKEFEDHRDDMIKLVYEIEDTSKAELISNIILNKQIDPNRKYFMDKYDLWIAAFKHCSENKCKLNFGLVENVSKQNST